MIVRIWGIHCIGVPLHRHSLYIKIPLYMGTSPDIGVTLYMGYLIVEDPLYLYGATLT